MTISINATDERLPQTDRHRAGSYPRGKQLRAISNSTDEIGRKLASDTIAPLGYYPLRTCGLNPSKGTLQKNYTAETKRDPEHQCTARIEAGFAMKEIATSEEALESRSQRTFGTKNEK